MTIGKTKLPVNERRELVLVKKREGKSNRAIALELSVDEGTIRKDLLFLEMPLAERPVQRRVGRKPRPQQAKAERTPAKKIVKAPAQLNAVPVYDPQDKKSLHTQEQKTIKALVSWYSGQQLHPRDAEDIGREAGIRLWRDSKPRREIPTKPSENVIADAKPELPPADDLQHVEWHGIWLARAIFFCLPDQEGLYDSILREVVMRTRMLR